MASSHVLPYLAFESDIYKIEGNLNFEHLN